MKYRIIEKTGEYNNKYYIVQYKFLFWWKNKKFNTNCMHSYSNGYTYDKESVLFNDLKSAKNVIYNYKKIHYKHFIIKPYIDNTTNNILYMVYNSGNPISITDNIESAKYDIDKYCKKKELKRKIKIIEEINI